MAAYNPQGQVDVSLLDGDIPVLSYNTSNLLSRASTVASTVTTRTLPPIQNKKNYENGTYIDWAKESQPKYWPSLTSLKWFTLVASSLLVGYITTLIDLVSVWLNDLRKGLCFSKRDKWSLLNPYSTCPKDEWSDWSEIFFNFDNKWTSALVDFPIYAFLSIIWCLIAVYITVSKEPRIRQSGIPEVKAIISGLNYDLPNYLGKRTLFYKVIGLCFVVSSGLWLGKEGPLVHVSCCLLNIVYSLVYRLDDPRRKHEGLRRELLSAAVATGISVAFNSPIGGVLFVLEALPSYFFPTKIMWNSFVSATIASVILTGFKIFTEGENFNEGDLFQVNFGNFSWLFMEIIPFLLLGILGGYFGFFYTMFYKKVSSVKFKSALHKKLCSIFHLAEGYGPFIEIVLLVLINTLLSFPVSMKKLPLAAYLKMLFTDCPPEDSNLDSNSATFMCKSSTPITLLKLLYIMVQGFLVSAYSFGLPIPGGVLMPSLVIGATVGRLLGILSQIFQNLFDFDYLSTCTEKSCLVSPSSYAVVGAAAFMSGLTKLTMCVVVIIFEITGAVTYVLPIMCSVMVLKFVNDWLCNENIYDSWLISNLNTKDSNDHINPRNVGLNDGKGNGLCDFTNLIPSVKLKLPDIPVKEAMVPASSIQCIELFPDDGPKTIENYQKFISSNNHEGYPLIVSYSNPISLGYVSRLELLDKVTKVKDSSKIVSFQLADLSNNLCSQQAQFELEIPDESLVRVDLQTEVSYLLVNDDMPLLLVLEMFEKLSLNYLIIMNGDASYKDYMCGFVDRFILSRLIDSKFESLTDYNLYEQEVREFDLESALEDDRLVHRRRDRVSIELLT